MQGRQDTVCGQRIPFKVLPALGTPQISQVAAPVLNTCFSRQKLCLESSMQGRLYMNVLALNLQAPEPPEQSASCVRCNGLLIYFQLCPHMAAT